MVLGCLFVGMGVGVVIGWICGSAMADDRWQEQLRAQARKLRAMRDEEWGQR